jgi:uncharacterized membrane protein HdeD (DUF308 family)
MNKIKTLDEIKRSIERLSLGLIIVFLTIGFMVAGIYLIIASYYHIEFQSKLSSFILGVFFFCVGFYLSVYFLKDYLEEKEEKEND